MRKFYSLVFFLPLIFWVFSSCAKSEEKVETLIEINKLEEERLESPNGWIQIGPETFELVFKCYKNQLGEAAAIGTGEDPDTGESVEALIQGFTGRPYVGLLKNGLTMFEASLKERLDISLDDLEIKSGPISWQKNIDLESSYGESAGYGSFFIKCEQFEKDLLEEKIVD